MLFSHSQLEVWFLQFWLIIWHSELICTVQYSLRDPFSLWQEYTNWFLIFASKVYSHSSIPGKESTMTLTRIKHSLKMDEWSTRLYKIKVWFVLLGKPLKRLCRTLHYVFFFYQRSTKVLSRKRRMNNHLKECLRRQRSIKVSFFVYMYGSLGNLFT